VKGGVLANGAGIFNICSLQQSSGVVCQKFLKMGAKKQQTFFKIYCFMRALNVKNVI